ncbi:CBS domain-containing protein [Candidatus Bathyarchaeota archaeon]|nr:MAG: CBS domain-containing protein [Candidatus Bathyarchaeota archaeon]
MRDLLPLLDEISRRRKEAGLTQSKLAGIAGVSQSIIAKIESGSVDPSYSIVRKLFSALDSFKAESASGEDRVRRAGELMSRGVVWVGKNQLVRDAVTVMRRRGYSQLPVLDGGRSIGSLSEKTVLDRAAHGENLEELFRRRVGDVMESPLPVVNEDTSVDALYGLLRENYAVLVSRGNEVIGILAKSDLLKTRRTS